MRWNCSIYAHNNRNTRIWNQIDSKLISAQLLKRDKISKCACSYVYQWKEIWVKNMLKMNIYDQNKNNDFNLVSYFQMQLFIFLKRKIFIHNVIMEIIITSFYKIFQHIDEKKLWHFMRSIPIVMFVDTVSTAEWLYLRWWLSEFKWNELKCASIQSNHCVKEH